MIHGGIMLRETAVMNTQKVMIHDIYFQQWMPSIIQQGHMSYSLETCNMLLLVNAHQSFMLNRDIIMLHIWGMAYKFVRFGRKKLRCFGLESQGECY